MRMAPGGLPPVVTAGFPSAAGGGASLAGAGTTPSAAGAVIRRTVMGAWAVFTLAVVVPVAPIVMPSLVASSAVASVLFEQPVSAEFALRIMAAARNFSRSSFMLRPSW
jgi:hypothetical protein